MAYTREDIIVGLAYVVTVVITYGSQAGVFGATNKDVRHLPSSPFQVSAVLHVPKCIAVAAAC